MNKKQIILPTFVEPLLLEIYFSNYVKYKKDVDRLVLLYNSPREPKKLNSYPGRHAQDAKILEDILKKYQIQNYVVKDVGLYNGDIGGLYKSGILYILEDGYDTYFDEVDNWWLNNDFQDAFNMLGQFDMVSGEKNLLFDKENLIKFNEKNGLHHLGPELYMSHITKFVKGDILKGLDMEFSAPKRPVDFDNLVNVKQKPFYERKGMCLDTFEYIDIQIYTKSDKIRLFNRKNWIVPDDFYPHLQNFNFSKIFLFHLIGSCNLYYARLCDSVPDSDYYKKILIHGPRSKFNLAFLFQMLNLLETKGVVFDVCNYKKSLLPLVNQEFNSSNQLDDFINLII